MTVKLNKGSTIHIGPAIGDDTNTIEEYAALTYVQIGEPEDFGEVGDESTFTPFTSVSAARTKQLKGARSAGTQTFIVGRDLLDAGQLALMEAEKTDYDYAMKIEHNDQRTPSHTKSVTYYRVQVGSQRGRFGTNDNAVRTVFSLAVQDAPLLVPTEIA